MNNLKVGDWVTVLTKELKQYGQCIAKHGYVDSLHENHANIIIEVAHPHMNTYYFPLPYEYNRLIKH